MINVRPVSAVTTARQHGRDRGGRLPAAHTQCGTPAPTTHAQRRHNTQNASQAPGAISHIEMALSHGASWQGGGLLLAQLLVVPAARLPQGDCDPCARNVRTALASTRCKRPAPGARANMPAPQCMRSSNTQAQLRTAQHPQCQRSRRHPTSSRLSHGGAPAASRITPSCQMR